MKIEHNPLHSLFGPDGEFVMDDSAPQQESMRGDRRFPSAPSTDQKKIRRLIHRSGAHAFGEVDWDEIHPTLKNWADNGEIHRGVGVTLPDDLHRFVHDESQPMHERAHALLRHLTGERERGDHRSGLGMHWSLNNSVAENSAEHFADHHADTNANAQDAHDFSWGRTPGEEPDYQDLQDHLHEDHGLHPDEQPEDEQLAGFHTHLHRGPSPMSGQQTLFPQPAHDPKRLEHTQMGPELDPATPHGKPATAVVLHTPVPEIHDIETHLHGNPNAGGDVYHPFGHGEREVPIVSGTSLPITGVSWKPVHEWSQAPEPEPDYVHHRFGDHDVPHHEAKKTATVLNTQIERLNKGDQIRTPTGQTSVVHGIRPHETDSRIIYLDTDMGTSTVKKGTDFQVVPKNSQQQELPGIGNPMGGNSAQLPGAGNTPGGPGAGGSKQINTAQTPCPNCGNTGTLHLQGENYVCSTCGFTVAAGGSPGGLLFSNQPHGVMPGRRKPGEVPKAHVWASKYITTNAESQLTRRARQVLGGAE